MATRADSSVSLKQELRALRMLPNDARPKQYYDRRAAAEQAVADYLYRVVESAMIAMARENDFNTTAVVFETPFLSDSKVHKLFSAHIRNNELQFCQVFPTKPLVGQGEPVLEFTEIPPPSKLEQQLVSSGVPQYFIVWDLGDGHKSKYWLHATSYQVVTNPMWSRHMFV